MPLPAIIFDEEGWREPLREGINTADTVNCDYRKLDGRLSVAYHKYAPHNAEGFKRIRAYLNEKYTQGIVSKEFALLIMTYHDVETRPVDLLHIHVDPRIFKEVICLEISRIAVEHGLRCYISSNKLYGCPTAYYRLVVFPQNMQEVEVHNALNQTTGTTATIGDGNNPTW